MQQIKVTKDRAALFSRFEDDALSSTSIRFIRLKTLRNFDASNQRIVVMLTDNRFILYVYERTQLDVLKGHIIIIYRRSQIRSPNLFFAFAFQPPLPIFVTSNNQFINKGQIIIFSSSHPHLHTRI